MNKKIKILSLTLIFVLLLVPAALAQEVDETEESDQFNFEDYDLDYLTEEELALLENEINNMFDNYEDITEEDIAAILEELELENDEEGEESLGQGLSSAIEEFKNSFESKDEWTGQDLSAMIQDYLDERLDNRQKNKKEEATEQNMEKENNRNEIANENKNKAKSNKKNNKGK